MHVAHTCGRGLSVLGSGNCGADGAVEEVELERAPDFGPAQGSVSSVARAEWRFSSPEPSGEVSVSSFTVPSTAAGGGGGMPA
jgi:hypothetical protein